MSLGKRKPDYEAQRAVVKADEIRGPTKVRRSNDHMRAG